MAVNYFDYRAGLGNVGSYQASAKPFLSSSIKNPLIMQLYKLIWKEL